MWLARGVAANRDFVRLWGAEAISRVGTQVSLLALPLTAIFTLHARPAQLGLIGAAQFAPVLVVTPLAGAWTDTHRRRPVIVAANWGRAAVLGSVPLLYGLDALRIEWLYAAAFLAGALTAAFDVAYLSYVPSLVRPDELTSANSALQASYSAAQVVGPSLGGLLVEAFSAPVAVLVDAVSYAVAALGVHRIRRPEPEPPPGGGEHVYARIVQGLRATFGDRHLAPLALESAWFNLFEQAVLTIFPLYATRELGLSAGLLGATLTVGSVGALAGSLVARPLGRRIGFGGATILAVVLASAGPALLVGPAGGAAAGALPFLFGAFALYGAGTTVFNVHATTLRQAVVPNELLGRVTASWRLVSYGTIPIGSLLGGTLGQAIGLRETLVVAASALGVGAVAFALSPIGALRRLPAPAVDRASRRL